MGFLVLEMIDDTHFGGGLGMSSWMKNEIEGKEGKRESIN